MASEYSKIPGIGTGRGSFQVALRARLYQGPDHLLIVYSTGYTEEYKRIFYRDIRYVEVKKSDRAIWYGLISGSAMLLLILCALANPGATIPILIFGIPFLIWFVINLLLGSGCVCRINTNVQTLELPAPRRKRKVAFLIDFLRSKTEAVNTSTTEQPAA